MVKDGLVYVFDINGNLLYRSISAVRGKSNSTPVVFISPNPLSMPVQVTHLIKDSINQDITQFLIPTNQKVNVWVETDEPIYQTIKDWSVFEANIKEEALGKISRFYQGSIGQSFTQYNVVLSELATNYKGEFGVDDLPSSASEGDYYKCIKGEYESAESGITFTYGEYAVYHDGNWIKGSSYVLQLQTTTYDVSVDPSARGQVPVIPNEDVVLIMQAMGEQQQEINDLKVKVDNLITITEEEVEW